MQNEKKLHKNKKNQISSSLPTAIISFFVTFYTPIIITRKVCSSLSHQPHALRDPFPSPENLQLQRYSRRRLVHVNSVYLLEVLDYTCVRIEPPSEESPEIAGTSPHFRHRARATTRIRRQEGHDEFDKSHVSTHWR